ncbi:Scr1 family TA system antitoxin-like transcriptional regulator [Kitasatospora sp. NPDC048286]|uniref:helix-turn-helix domain-containing protein n=1 Tax=Kitasatospora sp. NPDC048286 TaxID=3364047 RepID=UPI0037156274
MNRRTLDPTSSPLAALVVHLRASRDAKGLTQVGLGKLVGYSNVYISNVETGKQAPSLNFVRLCDAALETNGSLELLWWSWKNGSLIPGFPEFAAKEREALAIRLFELDMVPGILQHLDYSAAYESAPVRRGEATQEQADERLKLLSVRQRLLDRTPAIHVVLDESALRRPIGGPAVMARQLQLLEHLAARPNIVVQVAPYTLGEERPFSHAVTLLTLPNRAMVGYTETLQRGFLEQDAGVVSRWAGMYDRLQVNALNQPDSLVVIREARKDCERHAT